MKPLEQVQVYSSYAYAVEPRAFYFQGQQHRVSEVRRAWKSPGHIHFYVRDEQQRFFELVYDQTQDYWSVIAR